LADRGVSCCPAHRAAQPFSARVVFSFLDRQGGVGQAIEAEFIPAMAKAIQFDKVSLKEPGTGRKLLTNVTLTIKAGERVAIVGADETEKHALIYLLPGFSILARRNSHRRQEPALGDSRFIANPDCDGVAT